MRFHSRAKETLRSGTGGGIGGHLRGTGDVRKSAVGYRCGRRGNAVLGTRPGLDLRCELLLGGRHDPMFFCAREPGCDERRRAVRRERRSSGGGRSAAGRGPWKIVAFFVQAETRGVGVSIDDHAIRMCISRASARSDRPHVRAAGIFGYRTPCAAAEPIP